MSTAKIRIPEKLRPVFRGRADVRGAYGGRGSGKTRSFAKMIAVQGYKFGCEGISGQLLCCRQFMNSLTDSSLEECKRAIEEEPFLLDYYEISEKSIKSKNGRIEFVFAGLDRSVESIKSKGRILICWVDEAEPVTETAWSILVPTLREEGDGWNAELWITWNPKRKNSAVESRYRYIEDDLVKVVELNWQDNPKFPERLERERQRDLRYRPDQYAHIWGGQHVSIVEGAYYAKQIAESKEQNRICKLTVDNMIKLRSYWDIGGTGRKSDATSIWIVQVIGKEVRFLDYYEAVGQPLNSHVNWLRDSGYDKALCVLPHDGDHSDKIWVTSYRSELERAGFTCDVIPNQGAGAAIKRIEATREQFPNYWIDIDKCQAGIDAIGWYHAKIDDKRNVDLGPDHDWSSHAADAFGMVAISLEQLNDIQQYKKMNYPRFNYA